MVEPNPANYTEGHGRKQANSLARAPGEGTGSGVAARSSGGAWAYFTISTVACGGGRYQICVICAAVLPAAEIAAASA